MNIIENLKALEDYLCTNIRGQNHVIQRVMSIITRGELELYNEERPKGSFLFVGPTGVGKTEITLCFTEFLFGKGKLRRFDMSEYQNQDAIKILLGTGKGDGGLMEKAVELPCSTFLFDEIEKAHPLVWDIFLQVIDAGRLTLANGKVINFTDKYIVFTSNIGASDAMQMERSGYSAIERTVLKQVHQTFRPEFIARITEKVVFHRLTYEIQREICELIIKKEIKRLAKKGYEISLTKLAVEHLIRIGYDRNLGARPMRATVERMIQDAIALDKMSGGDGCGILDEDRPNQRLKLQSEILSSCSV